MGGLSTGMTIVVIFTPILGVAVWLYAVILNRMDDARSLADVNEAPEN
jgi:hypothetical protein